MHEITPAPSITYHQQSIPNHATCKAPDMGYFQGDFIGLGPEGTIPINYLKSKD
jgi:hypothetical protein